MLVGDISRCVDENETGHALGVVTGEGDSGRAAEAMPDEHEARERERVRDHANIFGQRIDRVVEVPRRLRSAVTAQVERDCPSVGPHVLELRRPMR